MELGVEVNFLFNSLDDVLGVCCLSCALPVLPIFGGHFFFSVGGSFPFCLVLPL